MYNTFSGQRLFVIYCGNALLLETFRPWFKQGYKNVQMRRHNFSYCFSLWWKSWICRNLRFGARNKFYFYKVQLHPKAILDGATELLAVYLRLTATQTNSVVLHVIHYFSCLAFHELCCSLSTVVWYSCLDVLCSELQLYTLIQFLSFSSKKKKKTWLTWFNLVKNDGSRIRFHNI